MGATHIDPQSRGAPWGRGLHFAPFTVDGCRVLMAITSQHDLADAVVLRPHIAESHARRLLNAVLRLADPPEVRLKLIRPEKPPRWVCEYDPAANALMWAQGVG